MPSQIQKESSFQIFYFRFIPWVKLSHQSHGGITEHTLESGIYGQLSLSYDNRSHVKFVISDIRQIFLGKYGKSQLQSPCASTTPLTAEFCCLFEMPAFNIHKHICAMNPLNLKGPLEIQSDDRIFAYLLVTQHFGTELPGNRPPEFNKQQSINRIWRPLKMINGYRSSS